MPIHFADLGLSPVALDLGIFQLRWYAISYVAMIGLGWWYVRKLIARPGAPMSARHADDLVSWIMLGVLIGGRLGYCLVYQPQIWRTPWKVLELWNGGMSLHGGLAGVLLAMWWFARRNNLQLLRLYDYIACCTPFGLFLVRIANFVNGELWGRPSDLPWAMVFPGSGDGIPRHPSQLYEAFLEGGLAMLVLWFLFWKTDARYHPGRLVGTGLTLYGVTRFLLEFTRQPDRGLEHLSWGLTMGQTLCLPMVIAGLWLLIRSRTTPPASDPGRSMSPFEFFMTFYGLLLGLAVAELLGSFANLLRAPVRPRLGLLTPILGAQYLIQIMTTFFDAFVKLQNVAANFAGFALPTVIGMTFFAGAVMVVPRRAEDWSSLDAYFFHQRKWTVGAMVLAFFATVLIELPSVWGFVMAGDWPRFTFYAAMNGVLLASLIIPLFARSRIVIAASLIFNAALLIYLYSPFAFRPFSGG